MAYHWASRLITADTEDALHGIGAEVKDGKAVLRAAINTLLAKKKEKPERTTSGFYSKRLKDVVGGLRGWMLQFSSLLLHRLVEEHRYAVMLAEVEEGRTIHMSREPEMENPDTEREGTNIGQWSLENIKSIKQMLRTRKAKTKNLHDEFEKLGKAMQDARAWLETAIPIYSKHMSDLDKMSPDNDNRERKKVDRDRSRTNQKFNPKAPKISWDQRHLFSNRPEADNWLLKQWGNIYKHGNNPNELTPMSLDYEAHASASLLENRMVELRSRSWDSWARDIDGKHPVFLDSAWRLLIACEAALDEDDELVAKEWEYTHEIEQGPLRITGTRQGQQGSRTPRNERDWSRFTRVKEKHTFEERIERKKRKYKRDKLGRFTK